MSESATLALDNCADTYHIDSMPKPIQLVKPMSAQDFVDQVRDRARFSHMVRQTEHLKQRMAERDITIRQVLTVLRKGTLAEGPTINREYGTYEGKMKRHATGREITVVCAIQGESLTVIAMTVY